MALFAMNLEKRTIEELQQRLLFEQKYGGIKKEGDQVDLYGDGKVTKVIKMPGDGSLVPLGAKVHIRYVGKLEGGEVFDHSGDAPYAEAPRTFRLGPGGGELLPAVAALLATMQVGEVATLRVHPDHGYGATGDGGRVGPGQALVYDVGMVGFARPPRLGPHHLVIALLVACVAAYILWTVGKDRGGVVSGGGGGGRGGGAYYNEEEGGPPARGGEEGAQSAAVGEEL